LTSTPPTVRAFSGSHYEMGLAHGRAFRAEIGQLYEKYLIGGLVRTEGWSLADLVAIGHHYEPFIPVQYSDEMRGIAEGSGLSYEQVLAMNTYPDAILGATPRACSAFAVRTVNGLLVGRNLDWTNYGVAHRYGVVQILRPSDGHRVLSVSWPGLVGCVTGMNDQGLVVTLNMAYASDLATDATPLLMRLRAVLEQQSSIQGAVGSLTCQPRTFAANVLVASARENDAVIVELSGRRHAVVGMQDGVVVTTNHYQSLGIRGGAGADRTAILRAFLHETGERTTPRNAQMALSKVCFRGSSLGMITNQSVVFMPADLVAQVALGKLPATSGRYFDVRLTD
jgi:isopenicillin-N N-acyltransferase like protein